MAEVKHKETGRHLRAFEGWYQADRDFGKSREIAAVSDDTLRNWAEWFGWREKADRRDREAADRADRDAIRRRAAMLIKCRQAGELMVTRGIERLAAKKLDSEQVAISAIKTGSDVWRTAEGLPAWAVEVLEATPDKLATMEHDLDARRRAAMGAGEETPELARNGSGH